MRQRPFPLLVRLGSAIALSGVLMCAQAVELGDIVVRSHLGQPLSADIELTGIGNESATVQADLADAEVYRSANIAIHPAVAALTITVVRRDGKRFLRLASSRLVESEFVHIFFELNENGRRAVRQSTLWFSADPRPKPAPMPVVATVAAASVAVPVAPASPPPLAPPVALAPRRPMSPMMAPAACVQQFTAAQIGTCAALDANNTALSAQIIELEEKVRRLTAAMHAGAVAPVASATPAAPKAPPTVLSPMGAPLRKPAGATPWLFIGVASAAVFALVGVLLMLLQRKRKAAGSTPAARVGPGLIASVKDRLLRGRKAADMPAAVEPTVG